MRHITVTTEVCQRTQGVTFVPVRSTTVKVPVYESHELSPAFIIKNEEPKVSDKNIYFIDGRLYYPNPGRSSWKNGFNPQMNGWGNVTHVESDVYIEPNAKVDWESFDNGTHFWVDRIVVDNEEYNLVSEPFYYVTKRGKNRTLVVSCEFVGAKGNLNIVPAYNANELQDALNTKFTSLKQSSRYYYKGAEWIEVMDPAAVSIPARPGRVKKTSMAAMNNLQNAVEQLQKCIDDGTDESNALAAINSINEAVNKMKALGF